MQREKGDLSIFCEKCDSMKIYLPSNYYREKSAEQTKPYPGESHEGWGREMLPIETNTTAIVCMHATFAGEDGQFPGWERCVDYIRRANKICREDLRPFLDKVRKTDMKIVHVASTPSYLGNCPGYKKTLELFGNEPDNYPSDYLAGDATVNELRNFKVHNSFPGDENYADYAEGHKYYDFIKDTAPLDNEFVVTTSKQLVSYCRHFNIHHLIYTGFAINMCLMSSPCGMVDMSRYGVMCSSVRELVTAVECRESARGEKHKEYGLYYDALLYGLVYNREDLEKYVLDKLCTGE